MNPLGCIKFLSCFYIFRDGISEEVDYHRSFDFSQERKFLPYEVVYADILQTNRIEHACRGLNKTGRGIACFGFKGKTLYNNGSQFIEINKFSIFITVSKRT